ncbi:MAG: hypothetical protein ACYDHP_00595 [Ferrimicrobium sp.]
MAQIEYDGMIVEWDGDAEVSEVVTIKAHTGKGYMSFMAGLGDADPQCMQGALWLLKRRNGQTNVDIRAQNPRVLALLKALRPLWKEINASEGEDEGPKAQTEPSAGAAPILGSTPIHMRSDVDGLPGSSITSTSTPTGWSA